MIFVTDVFEHMLLKGGTNFVSKFPSFVTDCSKRLLGEIMLIFPSPLN